MRRIKYLTIITIITILSSCTCNWHIKKIKQKCDIDQEVITLRDTIRIPEVRTDSVFFYNQKDTVIIQKDNLQIKYFYSNDSVYIDGTCKEQTIIKERVVTVNKYSKRVDWYWWVIGFLVSLIVIKKVNLI